MTPKKALSIIKEAQPIYWTQRKGGETVFKPDKEFLEAINAIEGQLNILRILKKHAKKIAEFPGQEKEPDIQIVVMPEADEDYEIIAKWLEESK